MSTERHRQKYRPNGWILRSVRPNRWSINCQDWLGIYDVSVKNENNWKLEINWKTVQIWGKGRVQRKIRGTGLHKKRKDKNGFWLKRPTANKNSASSNKRILWRWEGACTSFLFRLASRNKKIPHGYTKRRWNCVRLGYYNQINSNYCSSYGFPPDLNYRFWSMGLVDI